MYLGKELLICAIRFAEAFVKIKIYAGRRSEKGSFRPARSFCEGDSL